MAEPVRCDLKDLTSQIPAKIDLFICSASYEERCLSIPESLPSGMVGTALICANQDHLNKMEGHLGRISKHFGDRSRQVMLRTDHPLTGADNLLAATKQIHTSSPQTVLLDITTFTHEGLLIVLKVLAAVWIENDHRLLLAYSPAREYSVGLEAKDKWLSQGIRDIRSVLGYPGLLRPARKLHLVVLVGFEVERARMLIDTCEPDVISLGAGRDATDSRQAHLLKNIETLQRLSVHYPKLNVFEFSCVDLNFTMTAIEQQTLKNPEHNTVVAPMNTKLSTVAAALYASRNKDIQLCYAPAAAYNPRYSSPGEQCLIIEISLRLLQ